MNLSYKELNTGLYDKKMRVELRENPKKVLGNSPPFEDTKEYKVVTSSKKITYIAVPHRNTPPLDKIAAGTKRKDSPWDVSTISTACSTLGCMSSVKMDSHGNRI